MDFFIPLRYTSLIRKLYSISARTDTRRATRPFRRCIFSPPELPHRDFAVVLRIRSVSTRLIEEDNASRMNDRVN